MKRIKQAGHLQMSETEIEDLLIEIMDTADFVELDSVDVLREKLGDVVTICHDILYSDVQDFTDETDTADEVDNHYDTKKETIH